MSVLVLEPNPSGAIDLPGIADLTIYRGDTWTQTFRLSDSPGVPHNLTGATVTARAGQTALQTAVVAPATGGVITVGAAAGLLAAGSYAYDVQVTNPDSSVKTWIRGQLDVLSDVTP